jgi:hypothetical protein
VRAVDRNHVAAGAVAHRADDLAAHDHVAGAEAGRDSREVRVERVDRRRLLGVFEHDVAAVFLNLLAIGTGIL